MFKKYLSMYGFEMYKTNFIYASDEPGSNIFQKVTLLAKHICQIFGALCILNN